VINELQKSNLYDMTSRKYLYPDDILFPYSHRNPIDFEKNGSTCSLLPLQQIYLENPSTLLDHNIHHRAPLKVQNKEPTSSPSILNREEETKYVRSLAIALYFYDGALS
jgi:hypothetical protein